MTIVTERAAREQTRARYPDSEGFVERDGVRVFERVADAVFIGASLPRAPPSAERAAVMERFDEVLDTDEGWAKFNRHYWPRDYEGFLHFLFTQCLTEPHSTKQIEDAVGWGLDTDARHCS
jgi:hypothetical protein